MEFALHEIVNWRRMTFWQWSWKCTTVEISHYDSRADISKLFGHPSQKAIERSHLGVAPGWVLSQPKMRTTEFTDKTWIWSFLKRLLPQNDLRSYLSIYWRNTTFTWLKECMIHYKALFFGMDLHSHNVSIPYCQLFEVYHCAFISCSEWLSKLTPTVAAHKKAF